MVIPILAEYAQDLGSQQQLFKATRSPVHAPQKIVCVGLNYHGHMTETGRQPVTHPTLFSRWSDSHVGHGEQLILPSVSTKFDYEGELAVVVGRSGRHISKTEAMTYVAGYSCYNDGSIRDWQKHTSQFLPGKNFEASGAFGPWLVAGHAVPDYRELRLTTRLNGRVVQDASLGDLIFDIPTLIEYVSSFTTLNPGDVLVTGTPDGVGAFRDPQLWMGAGDTVEVEISGIGMLSNKILAEQDHARAARLHAAAL
ncbi:fumarylacetoacetate hydrolase family protein [Sinorhizobium fredii]|uniref:fumarylacetoacetate hydrolase family protein n=1 Tax=Rhizobium fredii TaxID=380 RepID=UPI003397DACB